MVSNKLKDYKNPVTEAGISKIFDMFEGTATKLEFLIDPENCTMFSTLEMFPDNEVFRRINFRMSILQRLKLIFRCLFRRRVTIRYTSSDRGVEFND